MKKILLIDYDYPEGGPKTVAANLMRSALAKKYEFKVISINNKAAALHYHPLKAIKFLRYYIKRINAEKADIAYIRGLEYVGFLMTLAAWISNVRSTILVVHGSSWDIKGNSLRQIFLKYIIEPIEVCLADKVYTVCQAEQKTAKCLRFARKNANIGTIYNSFPTIDYESILPGKLRSMLHIPPEKIIVSIVGRVTERKGHRYVIEALHKMHSPNFVFVIIGDGEFVEKYRRECADDIKDGRLFILGSRNNVYELFRDTDIFLFPTLNENHSMALLEAVAMRCATVVTNVGGNIETIENGVSGVVIEPANADEIIKGLMSLHNKKTREKLASRAYDYCRLAFSEEKTISKLNELFSSLPAAGTRKERKK